MPPKCAFHMAACQSGEFTWVVVPYCECGGWCTSERVTDIAGSVEAAKAAFMEHYDQENG